MFIHHHSIHGLFVQPPLYLLLFVVLTASTCSPSSDDASMPEPFPSFAQPLAVHWELIHNFPADAQGFTSVLTLTNQGEGTLEPRSWTLYFNFARNISTTDTPPLVDVTHINGDFYSVHPTEQFPTLAPGESVSLSLVGSDWVINASEAPAGFYVVYTDGTGEPTPPLPVAGVTIAPFTTPQQTNRSATDVVPVSTPALRYAANERLALPPEDTVSPITPSPVQYQPGMGTWTLDPEVVIHYATGLDNEASYLAAALEPLLGQRLKLVEGGAEGPQRLVLRTSTITVAGQPRQQGDEAYRLTVDTEGGVEIIGTDAAGVLYGIQSLRSLLPLAAYARPQEGLTIAAATVEDAPRFGYRGFHLDVARNFQSKETVLKLLDLMAFYKLNKFHFHLTDDEGWRVEIDRLPELTEVGARRGHTVDERDHLVPSFGSGPDPADSHGSGHYTRTDFIEILQYAHDRHIEVIPEIDLPGHARAAIKAMEAREARRVAAGASETEETLLLSHPDDASTYRSVQGWTDNVIDICAPSTYRFIEIIVDDLVAMYEEAGAPLTTLHTGGDEVPSGVWEKAPSCDALLASGENEVRQHEDLHEYFLRRVNRILSERGLTTAGWEEIALKASAEGGGHPNQPNPAFLEANFRPYVWNSVWGWGSEDVAYRLANAGYPIVLCNATNLYFDLAYNKHPDEPGYYWAAFVDTRKAFEFVPLDVYRSAWEDRMGHAIDPATYQHHERLTESGRQNVLGIQGQLWGENAKGQEQMEYLAFPKLLGLAERAWAVHPAWATIADATLRKRGLDEAWARFTHRLGKQELPRLDHLNEGVHYRLPVPGALIEDGLLKANTAYPGLTIRYTTDGREPTANDTLYEGPVQVVGTVKLKSFDRRGRGSRTAVVAE